MSAASPSINGKRVKDLIDLPFGKFAEMARKYVDPLWGKVVGETQAFKVVMGYTPEVENKFEEYFIEAADEDEAKELARELLRNNVRRFEDAWVNSCKVIG